MGMLNQAQQAATPSAPPAAAAPQDPTTEAPEQGAPSTSLDPDPSDPSGGFDAAAKALHNIVFGNAQGANSVMGMLRPENKLNSVIAVAVMLVGQLAQKMPMSSEAGMKLGDQAASDCIEIMSRVKKVKFSAAEAKAVHDGVAKILTHLQEPDDGSPDDEDAAAPDASSAPDAQEAAEPAAEEATETPGQEQQEPEVPQ